MRVILSSRQLLRTTLLLLFAATTLTVLSYVYDFANDFRFYSRHIKWLEDSRRKAYTNASLCHIPDYDPFDPSILKYVKKYKLKCPDDPHLTFVDENGYIHLNKSGFDAIQKTYEDIECVFYSLSGIEGDKDSLFHGPRRRVTANPTKVDANVVGVECVLVKSRTKYRTCHFYVPPPSSSLKLKNNQVQEQGRPSVILLAIDSVSRLSFIRHLPKTYKLLTEKLQAVIMKGLNKVGRNTHPNMIPFLSGYKMYGRSDDPTPAFCTSQARCAGYFDELPVVWRNFSRAGYVTMWLDEWLQYQLFYYDAKGFKQIPTDYYPRPLMQGLEEIGLSNHQNCAGSKPVFDFVLNYTESFVNAMEDNVYFAFPFISRISHDDPNTVQAMDDSLHGLLERLYDRGSLNNTILVLFGDHGLRFGEIRKTLLGTLEDRMPFMSIYLPKKLREQKPHLQAGLEVNSGRLLSWFDMYEMLMDLAMNNLEEVSRVPRWGFSVGLSPFRPFPENRTCEDAGIPLEYCVCMTPLDISVDNDVVLDSAERIVLEVNSKLRTVPGQPCTELSLKKVQSAQLIAHPSDVNTPNGLIELLRITITTSPNNALLQATFQRRASNQDGKLMGDIERLNKYANQSLCVDSYPDSRIHPLCYCLRPS